MRGVSFGLFFLLALSPAIAIAERPVQRCTSGENCINGILIIGKPTKAEALALEQALVDYNAAVARAATERAQAAKAETAKVPPLYQEPLPAGDGKTVSAAAANRCDHPARDLCIQMMMDDYKAFLAIWQLSDLAPEKRELLRLLIPRHTLDGFTNWGSALADYRLSTGITPRLPPGYLPPPPPYSFEHSCTFKTTTVGPPGNQTITSRMRCN